MKNLMNLGKILNKNEQKSINGGDGYYTHPGACWIACGHGCKLIEREWICI